MSPLSPAQVTTILHEHDRTIFISYSRHDSALVERLRADLQAAHFKLWIDRKGLKVGQKNWEQEIRSALADADCVVYVGSPSAAHSNYVGAEIAIAEEQKKPIFCLWADGDTWSQSAPLGLIKAQYVDVRGNAYAAGTAELIAALCDADKVDPPPKLTIPWMRIIALLAVISGILIALMVVIRQLPIMTNTPPTSIALTAPLPCWSNLVECSTSIQAIYVDGQSSASTVVSPEGLSFSFNNVQNGSGVAFLFKPALDVTTFKGLKITGTSTNAFTFLIEYKALSGGNLVTVKTSTRQQFTETRTSGVQTIAVPINFAGLVDQIIINFPDKGNTSTVVIRSVELSSADD